MKMATRHTGGAVILDVSGDIDLESSPELRKALLGSLKESPRVVLNLVRVRYIDSSGIGELVSGFTAVRNRGGELKLLNLTKKVHDLLQITKLFTVFDVFNEESTAVRSFE